MSDLMQLLVRIQTWILRLFGMGKTANLLSDSVKISNAIQSGDANAYQASVENLMDKNAQGAYGRPGVTFQSAPVQAASLEQSFAQRAMVDAQMAAQQRVQNANPALTAPIEGVTIEQYAQMVAQAAQLQGDAALDGFLAQHGMDRAKWSRVGDGWNARMRDDTSYSLVTIYGRAFGGAGAGQFGAAGAAGVAATAAAGMTGVASGAGGGEPVSWEKYNEIAGAQQAWSQSGKDVNAMLHQTFGISAVDWSNLSQYWMGRMMSDPQKMMEMTNLQQQWAARYAAPKADQDLQF